jgi:hypothetical protein
MFSEIKTRKGNMKLTRQEKRVLNDLGYYACFGSNYPIEKIRKILKLWILVFIASLPLLFVHILIPFLYFFSMVLVLYIGDKKKYFNYPDITCRKKYIQEYTLLKQENPSLNVETFAKSVKTFIAAQEKREAEQEHRKTKEEIETIKNQYGI